MEKYSPSINNIKYIIKNPNDMIESKLLKGDQYNSTLIDIILNYIKTKNLKHFLNIGSHIGSISLPISKNIKLVTDIEPYPSTYRHLCENILYNNITNIKTYNLAVGKKESICYFMSKEKICYKEKINRSLNNSGGMHIFTESDIKNNKRSSHLTDFKIKSNVYKLDDLNIDNFDIMLVDIEGSEYEMLIGARTKILKNKPIIIIEIWGNKKRKKENIIYSKRHIITYIKSMGYKLIKNIDDDYIFEPTNNTLLTQNCKLM